MQLEYVDVVFANRPDSNTPMEGRWSLKAQWGSLLHRHHDLCWQSTRVAACCSPFDIWSHLTHSSPPQSYFSPTPSIFCHPMRVRWLPLGLYAAPRSELEPCSAKERLSPPHLRETGVFLGPSPETQPLLCSLFLPPVPTQPPSAIIYFFAVLSSVLHQLVALSSAWSTLSSTGCPGRLALLRRKILSCLSTSPPMLLPPVSQQTVGGRSVVFFYSWALRTPCGVHQTFY